MIQILSIIILISTILTFVFAIVSYTIFKYKEYKKAGEKAQEVVQWNKQYIKDTQEREQQRRIAEAEYRAALKKKQLEELRKKQEYYNSIKWR